ncbi:RTA-like protein [Hypoxylon sp. FL1857]|nr:RTA-like protein [Hypoxylon sp. FL1857]
MVLGRLILLLRAESYSPVKPSMLTKVFVGGDLLCFFVQIIGSGQLSSNFSLAKIIILVGLVAQLIFFGLFVVVATVVHYRLARRPTPTAQRLDQLNTKMGWRGVTRVIYLASAMIFVRSIFRLVEFTGDHDSPMMKSEAYLYICDSTLMFGVLAILIYYHPAVYVPSRKVISHMNGEGLA